MVVDDKRQEALRRLAFYGTTRVSVVVNETYTFYPCNSYIYQFEPIRLVAQPQTKAEKNQARLKQLRGRAGRWA